MTMKTVKTRVAKRTSAKPVKAPVKAKAAIEVVEPVVHRADISKGEMITTLSKEWACRPLDQRFTSVSELSNTVTQRKDRSKELVVDVNDFNATGDFMSVVADGEEIPLYPSHAAFRQFCELLPAPADYVSKLPIEMQKQLLQHHIANSKNQSVKLLLSTNDKTELAQLRAITSPTYGRVWDADVIQALEWLLKIDPDWKVPGEFDWTTFKQNPFVETTKGNTTLFASDRDVFAFMCKDHMPIEVGKNTDGTTDVYFPGFYISNSETGHKGLSLSTMMLRGVCANRCLWGAEGVRSINIRHSKNAPAKFANASAATMKSLSEAEYMPFVRLITEARKQRLTKGQEETKALLKRLGFWQHETQRIIDIGIEEDQIEPETAYDISNAITAFARRSPNNDKRLMIEAKARQVLQMAA